MERASRQGVVAYLGEMVEAECLGVQQAAKGQAGSWQSRLFDEGGVSEWVEVDASLHSVSFTAYQGQSLGSDFPVLFGRSASPVRRPAV